MSKATIAVDAQMLQLLNDRICQTIDALNQVRWSAINNQRHLGVNAPLAHQQMGYGVTPFQQTAWNLPTQGAFYGHQNNFGAFRSEIPATGLGYGYRSDIPAAHQGFNGVYGTPAYNAAPVAGNHAYNAAPVAGTPVSMGF